MHPRAMVEWRYRRHLRSSEVRALTCPAHVMANVATHRRFLVEREAPAGILALTKGDVDYIIDVWFRPASAHVEGRVTALAAEWDDRLRSKLHREIEAFIDELAEAHEDQRFRDAGVRR